jgi:site-specific DNA-adenine methylase
MKVGSIVECINDIWEPRTLKSVPNRPFKSNAYVIRGIEEYKHGTGLHLEEIHNLIQNVLFECCDFTASLTTVDDNDFVYLDPPYAPETDTSFVGYTENGFNIENHQHLFGLIHILTNANKKIMLSNADVSLVRDNFTNEKCVCFIICCKGGFTVLCCKMTVNL